MKNIIPVILFVYARPNLLKQTLSCLKENQVPLLYVYSDAPRSLDKQSSVHEVREMIKKIDWCEVVLVQRERNMGLGRSILSGVTEILDKHDEVIIFEDDLICVPGTYNYLCEALEHYRDDPHVMSVTGWTHPHIIPKNINDLPYFDGRAECWVWGTWAKVWKEMNLDAMSLMKLCKMRGIDIYKYGADLPSMAKVEKKRNIWAVRWIYFHILNKGLALRPPWSMVNHIGFDSDATNTKVLSRWSNPNLGRCPPVPSNWPESCEHKELPEIWQRIEGAKPLVSKVIYYKMRYPLAILYRKIRKIFGIEP